MDKYPSNHSSTGSVPKVYKGELLDVFNKLNTSSLLTTMAISADILLLYL